MEASIFSEINPLDTVIIHHPGIEHLYVLPENLNEWVVKNNKLTHNPNYLLFDDLIQPEIANEEHKQLSTIIEHYIGKNHCIQFTSLIKDILDDQKIKTSLIKECIELDSSINKTNYSTSIISEITKMKNHQIIHFLLSGLHPKNYHDKLLKHPIPNLIYTRDIAAVIGNTILLTWGCRKVRRRENILSKYVFKHHPLFNNSKIYNFHKHHPNLTVEGGDIIILNKHTICIGISERTTIETINCLLPIFYSEGFSNIIAIDLPKKRSTMHLDTIFNRISADEVIVYPPFLDALNPSNIYYISSEQSIKEASLIKGNLLDVLASKNIHLNPIYCGGKEKIQQKREQWTDGANFFCIAPGIIIGYDRNKNTIESLRNAGYKCIDSFTFIKNPDNFKSFSKLLITIPSGELSRGRGGTRCLTLPIKRSINL